MASKIKSAEMTLEKLKGLLKQKGLSTAGDRLVLEGRLERRLEVEKSMERILKKEEAEGSDQDKLISEDAEGSDQDALISEEVIEDIGEEQTEDIGEEERWVVIHAMQPNTVAVGVYETEFAAQTAYIAFLMEDQELFNNILDQVEEEYPEANLHVRTDANHVAQELYTVNLGISDLFRDLSPTHEIANLPADETFDFGVYNDWDQDSLDRLLEHLANGTFGDARDHVEEEIEEDKCPKVPFAHVFTDKEIEVKILKSASKEYPMNLPKQVYDQGMLLVDFMTSLGLETGTMSYEDKQVSFLLSVLDRPVEFNRVTLDAKTSKKIDFYVNGETLQFRYYHRFPVGPTWFVTASA